MRDHLDQFLQRGLQYQRAAVWDVSQDEEGEYLGHVVSPAGEVGDDVLEGDESGADQFVVHVDGQAGEQVNQVVPCHVGWHDARDSCHTGLEEVQLGLDWAVQNEEQV